MQLKSKSKEKKQDDVASDFYSIKVKDCDGADIDLNKYRGKYLLIVNTASKCSFSKQIDGLEKLHNKFKQYNFSVIGFPCNQFAGQAPGSSQEECEIFKDQYGVTFPIMEKIKVNGSEENALYGYLKTNKPSNFGLKLVKWNFEKFLVGPNGEVLSRYSSITSPETIGNEISNKYITSEVIANMEAKKKEADSLDLLPSVDVHIDMEKEIEKQEEEHRRE